ncbi:MAG: hypothetical protein HKN09_08865 [Saprospiraceae bacterium]|nr:hypothetical protein [Saprospiraceae bacterium]
MINRLILALNCIMCLIPCIQAQEICDTKMSGMTLVAPPSPFSQNPMMPLLDINAQWVAVVPYAFTPNNEAKVYFGNNHQWWGETPEGVEETLSLAKDKGMNVMLKPQVWMHGSWVGDMSFDKERDWMTWEKDYKDYILTFARIAEKYNVELFCIGTEYKKAAVKRESYWRGLIEEVKNIYSGKLTYSANWDEYEDMPFWDALDYIGISAYFPLSESDDPTKKELKKAWGPIKKKIAKLSSHHNRPVVFTEYGYLSVDGCAGKTWILEKKRNQLKTNQKLQSTALEALFETFVNEEFWSGCFYWKWYPFGYGRESRRLNDYTPQGKMAEKTIRQWYSKF